MVAADARTAIALSLSSGKAHEGRKLFASLGGPDCPIYLIMDWAYEGDRTRQLALDREATPVVPPNANRIAARHYSKAICKRRNEIECLFRRLKDFRRISSRFWYRDVMLIAFIHFALIADAHR